MAVVLDPSGNAYMVVSTGSNDFPTVNPIQADFRGGVTSESPYSMLGPSEAFVAEFDTGGVMTFGTYLGGTGAEAGTGIALGPSGSVYVMGMTESTDFDTVNPYQDANAGGQDAFVARIGGLGPPMPPPVPIGGVVVPVNKLKLLAPWLGLAALASLAGLTVALVRKRKA